MKTNGRLIFIPFKHFIQRTQSLLTQKIKFTVQLLTFIKTHFKIWIRIILHKQTFCFFTVEGDFRSLSSQQINKPEKVNGNSKSHDESIRRIWIHDHIPLWINIMETIHWKLKHFNKCDIPNLISSWTEQSKILLQK